ncbi:MAG: hypothetical protein V1890_07325 [Candidatus Zixiibacteriota bacterium]
MDIKMLTKIWILDLYEKGILTKSSFDDKVYYHLKAPCKICLNENVTKRLIDEYVPGAEKGGILLAYPIKINEENILKVKDVIFIKNIAKNRSNGYLPDSNELDKITDKTLHSENKKFLPLRFHTHPTTGENEFFEVVNYAIQTNTSHQDQKASYIPYEIDGICLLMPRSLVVASRKLKNHMFIGFYGGLIAPIEFGTHKNEVMQRTLKATINQISNFVKTSENKTMLILAAVLLTILMFRYIKVALGIVFLISIMLPMYTNSECNDPKYYAQLSYGKVTIGIP